MNSLLFSRPHFLLYYISVRYINKSGVILKKIYPAIFLVIVIWIVFYIEFVFEISFSKYGIIPRHVTGLRGILLAPFLHANVYHLVSNTVPVLVLTLILFIFYYERAYHVLFWSVILTGIGVWLFGRPAIHLGISGVIYAFASFIFFAGIYKRKFLSIIISIAIVAVYGGLIWGLLPQKFYISYESHIAGFIAGFILARIYYKR